LAIFPATPEASEAPPSPLVEIFARRDVAQRVGFADHARRRAVQQENPLDEHVAQAALEQHRGKSSRGNFFQQFATLAGEHGGAHLPPPGANPKGLQ